MHSRQTIIGCDTTLMDILKPNAKRPQRSQGLAGRGDAPKKCQKKRNFILSLSLPASDRELKMQKLLQLDFDVY